TGSALKTGFGPQAVKDTPSAGASPNARTETVAEPVLRPGSSKIVQPPVLPSRVKLKLRPALVKPPKPGGPYNCVPFGRNTDTVAPLIVTDVIASPSC